jgi:hypothetical protein
MTRDNCKAHRTFRRHTFRLALCVALTTNASLTLADSGQAPQCQASSCSEPVYPFPPEPVRAEQHSASKRAIIKLLGIRSEKPLASMAKPIPSISVPSVSQISAVQIELPSLPSQAPVELQSAGGMPAPTATQSLPDLSLANLKVPSLPSQEVVVATAIRPIQSAENAAQDVVQEVEQEASQENTLALELMSALDDTVSPPAAIPNRQEQPKGFTDTFQIEVGSKEIEPRDDSVNFSLSDRSESTGQLNDLDHKAVEHGPKSTPRPIQRVASQALNSRKPELANTKQSTALRTVSSENRPESSRLNNFPFTAESNAPQMIQKVEASSLPNLASLPSAVNSPNPLGNSVVSVNAVSVQSPVAPQGIANQNSDEVPQASLANRPPLVPLLAGATGRKQPEKVVGELPSVQSKPAPADPGTIESIKEIKVTVKDAVSLQSADPIQGWSVEHEGVCQVIQTGHKSCFVVGLQPGETRVALFTETAGKRNVQIHQIAVGAASGPGSSSKSVAEDVSQTIRQLFPQSRVRITSRGNQLVVAGTVDSEDSAKKILSLVRKTTLVPVIDELRTR